MELSSILEPANLLYAVLIFTARVVDVSLGTLRTIAIVHGRTTMSFWLGFFESLIWLAVVATIVQTVANNPLLGIVYGFGFATGNLVGIKFEKIIAMGHLVLRITTRNNSEQIVDNIREKGYGVTTFSGRGRSGPVTLLYIVCRRRDIKKLLQIVLNLDPKAFYVTEQTGPISNIHKPIMQPVTGWRDIFKKK